MIKMVILARTFHEIESRTDKKQKTNGSSTVIERGFVDMHECKVNI